MRILCSRSTRAANRRSIRYGHGFPRSTIRPHRRDHHNPVLTRASQRADPVRMRRGLHMPGPTSNGDTMALIDVLTNRYGNARTGTNLNETVLRPDNVNRNQFGRLFSRQVDADIYPQPLVVTNLQIGGHVVNVVYVATANNSVYAFDADDPARAAPYWHLGPDKLGAPVPRSEVGQAGYADFARTIGITSTPVVDRGRGRLYFEVKSKHD